MKIAILTPCMTGMVNVAFCTALADTLKRITKSEVVFFTIVGSSILHGARNALVAKALAWGADRVVMLDDDVSWEPEDFQKLVLHPEAIVGGVYQKKKPNERGALSFAVSALPDGFRADHRGLVEVCGAATGFLRVDASVFEALKATNPKIYDESLTAAENAHLHTWFDFPVIQRDRGMQVMGEDYSFCHKARAAGYRIWIDPSIKLGHHIGGFKFDAALPAMNIL